MESIIQQYADTYLYRGQEKKIPNIKESFWNPPLREKPVLD